MERLPNGDFAITNIEIVIIGETVEKAREILSKYQRVVRVVEEDGKILSRIMNSYSGYRVDVIVEKGIIKKISSLS